VSHRRQADTGQSPWTWLITRSMFSCPSVGRGNYPESQATNTETTIHLVTTRCRILVTVKGVCCSLLYILRSLGRVMTSRRILDELSAQNKER